MTQIWLRVVLAGNAVLLVAILVAILAPGLPGNAIAAILGLMGALIAFVGLFQRV